MAHSQDGTADNNIVQLGDGIAVRALRVADVKTFSSHLNNKKIWDNLRNLIPHPYTEADGKWWIDHVWQPEFQLRSGRWTKEGGSDGPLVPSDYAITVNDEAVGAIGIVMGKDVYSRTAELGYWLGEAHWGKGIMSKVVPAFVEWVWKTFEILVRINAETYAHNAASGAVLKRAGFEYEGRRRNAACKNDQFVDVLLYGTLRPGSWQVL